VSVSDTPRGDFALYVMTLLRVTDDGDVNGAARLLWC
jgi:hypothetical protein